MPRGVKKTRFQIDEQDGDVVIIDTETPQVVKVANSDEVEDGPPLVVERYTAADNAKYIKARCAALNHGESTGDAEVAPEDAVGTVPPDGTPAQ